MGDPQQKVGPLEWTEKVNENKIPQNGGSSTQKKNLLTELWWTEPRVSGDQVHEKYPKANPVVISGSLCEWLNVNPFKDHPREILGRQCLESNQTHKTKYWGKLAKLDGSLTGKRAFLKQIFVMKWFSDGTILVTFLIQDLKMLFHSQVLWGTSTGVYQNLGKTSESSFLESAFSQFSLSKCRLSGNNFEGFAGAFIEFIPFCVNSIKWLWWTMTSTCRSRARQMLLWNNACAIAGAIAVCALRHHSFLSTSFTHTTRTCRAFATQIKLVEHYAGLCDKKDSWWYVCL